MEAYMEKNSEDPIKNENKDCPFVFSNFKKWLNNQSEEKENISSLKSNITVNKSKLPVSRKKKVTNFDIDYKKQFIPRVRK
jgi:hypothetical protein